MRTTVRLDEALLAQAKQEAQRRGTTLTAMMEDGLRTVLGRPSDATVSEPIDLPACRSGGGTRPGVDLNNSAELLEILEGLR